MSKKPNPNREVNVHSLYAELNKFGQNGEYEKALKTANKSKLYIFYFSFMFVTIKLFNLKSKIFCSVLNISTDETKAAHCKVICLIQVSKFQEAVQFIERSKLPLIFEKAYAEYRLNQPEKALETIDKSIDQSSVPLPPNLKELRAQVLYRLENFEDCFDAYRDIIKNTNDDYENERTTNLSAVVTNLAIMNSVSFCFCLFFLFFI